MTSFTESIIEQAATESSYTARGHNEHHIIQRS